MEDSRIIRLVAEMFSYMCRYGKKLSDPEALIDGDEVVRLMRLGQWAETYAIPMLEKKSQFYGECDCWLDAEKTLAKLLREVKL